MDKLKTKFRFLGLVLFILYILSLCYVLFFAEGFGRGMAVGGNGYNTVAFYLVAICSQPFHKYVIIDL